MNYKLSTPILLYLIILVISSSCTYHQNYKFDNKYKIYDQKNVKIVGTIISDITEKDYKYTFKLSVHSINNIKVSHSDYLLINISKQDVSYLKYGNLVCIYGAYEEPSTSRNYKGFNYKNYLKTQKIYGIVKSNIITILKEKNINSIDLLNNLIIENIKSSFKKVLPNRTGALATGILLGYTNDIDEDITHAFKDSNLTHMLAISGENTAYVILVINILLQKKIVGNRLQKFLTMILIIIFMKITGMTLSVVRAGITCIIYMCSSLLYKKADFINTISISAFLTLLYNPFNIFNVGMQLSYAGTISIVLFYEILENKIKTTNKILKYLLESISLSLSANLFIIPIMAYNFNTISLTFIFSNLLASPLIGIATILGVVVSLVSFFSISLASIISIPLNWCLSLVITIAKFFASISISKIVISTPSIILVFMTYLFLALCLLFYKSQKSFIFTFKKHIKLFSLILVFILTFKILFSSYFIYYQKHNLIIHFIDVGQGDSCLLETPANTKILIDSGGSMTPNLFDVGEKTLLPYLLDRKITKLDYVMISHFDADHCQGLEAVINSIKIKNLIISNQASICDEYKKIISLCKSKGINILLVKRGNIIKVDKYVSFKILNPSDNFIDDGRGGLNANAITAKLYYGKNFSVLFTGDIESSTEEQLIALYRDSLKSNIFKVPHHGSKTSSTKEFLKYVSPNIALIGVGKNNRFGHPNNEILSRLNSINAKIYRTDLNGEITIVVNNNGNFKITTML